MREVLEFEIPAKSCDKCTGVMEKGFVADYTGEGDLSAIQNIWVEGNYEKGWFGAKFKGKKKFIVSSYRCKNCGFLESFATEVKK